ncbi:MAG: hypothetical protein BroJett018_53660 [Chloroflexota bacterium]|nr:MAG: hypothetical protein BroJett018_53660 [Chloroflexota bacterium]
MKWVTWEHIGVDRMACIWVILRHIDPDAEFLFIPVGHTPLPEGYEPFDIPGVRLSHRQGQCSFQTILREYGLKDPILKHMAQIVTEADLVQEVSIEPAAYGLDLICRGLRRISPDDYVALERGCLVYDGLYAELSEAGG